MLEKTIRASGIILITALSLFVVPAVKTGTAQEPVSTGQSQPGQQPVLYVCPMHRDFSSKVPGKCSKCGMTLVAVGSADDQEIYSCPMHPDVMSSKPGKCPKCQMDLVRIPPPDAADFELRMETFPAVVNPDEKVKFRFTVFNPATRTQVTKFNILHERPFHLFVVSRDFTHFDHIHPALQPDGSFTIETVLPKAGHYQIFCDLFPAGGMPQVIFKSLITAGYRGDLETDEARIIPDKALSKTLDGMRFDLKFDPEQPVAGKPAILKYRITDAASGQPVTNLKPYLGAWGHTLILSADATDYIHSHPTEMVPDTGKIVASKSDVDFEAFFPRPGMYRVWSQFQRNDRITTVSFNLEVPRMN